MIVLGIDPGTAQTGYGVVEGDNAMRVSLVECGVIRTRARDRLPARLREIHEGVAELIARHRPDMLAVEDVFYAKNVRTTVVLGHARGVILLAARSAQLEVFEYSPRSVKSAVVGYGAAEKEQVAKMVRMLLPGCATLKMSADASDALAIAICHAHTAGTAARLKIRA